MAEKAAAPAASSHQPVRVRTREEMRRDQLASGEMQQVARARLAQAVFLGGLGALNDLKVKEDSRFEDQTESLGLFLVGAFLLVRVPVGHSNARRYEEVLVPLANVVQLTMA